MTDHISAIIADLRIVARFALMPGTIRIAADRADIVLVIAVCLPFSIPGIAPPADGHMPPCIFHI